MIPFVYENVDIPFTVARLIIYSAVIIKKTFLLFFVKKHFYHITLT